MISNSKRKLIIVVILISAAFLLIFEISSSVLSQQSNVLKNASEFSILYIATPTPFPLPKQTYDKSSLFTILWKQVFGKKSDIADPSAIIQSSRKLFTNDHIELYVEDDQLKIDSQWWQRESTEVFDYVSHNLDETFEGKISVVIVKSLKERCGPRGKTHFEPEPIIMLYADSTTSKEQLLAVFAHELGHVFINKKYEKLSDVALIEGMATWASGDYWMAWKGTDFDSYVKELVNKKAYLPLYQNHDLAKAYDQNNPDCIANRDELLAEFASFLDYLMSEYGTDKLTALFDIKQPEIGKKQSVVYPPNYKEVYGLELNQLEYNWLKQISGTNQ
jgi:hypothetical protein